MHFWHSISVDWRQPQKKGVELLIPIVKAWGIRSEFSMRNENRIIINIINNEASIYAAYNEEFVQKIKRHIGGARWDALARAWIVPIYAVDRVRAIMKEVFGIDDSIPEERELRTVKCTFHEGVEKVRGAVILYGKCIARATGRDSDAYPGDDVVIESGDIMSGGSARFWKSIVMPGTVAILKNVPYCLLEQNSSPRGIAIEILEDGEGEE